MANNVNQPAFKPAGAAVTVGLNATTSSGNVQVQSANNARHVRVVNAGANTVFLEFGDVNTVAAATATGMPVTSGSVEIFACPYKYIAAITSTGTSQCYFTPGEGL